MLCTALAAALATATPGQTLVVTGACPAPVAVPAHVWSPPAVVDARAATLPGVVASHVDGLTWVGGTFDGGGKVASGFDVTASAHITIEHASFTGYVRNGIGIGLSSAVVLRYNTVTGSGSDGIDFALSRDGLIDHNQCTGFVPTAGAHPDCIQLWSRPTAPPTADVTITFNTAIGNMQGISLFNHVRPDATGKLVDDGGFDRITIRWNTIRASYDDGLSVYSCRACTVRDNIVPADPVNVHANRVNLIGDTGGTMGTNDTAVRP